MIYKLIYIAITLLGLGVSIGDHGKPKTGKYNFWTSLTATGIVFFLLAKAGFFDDLIR